jgi:hypothetical protein
MEPVIGFRIVILPVAVIYSVDMLLRSGDGLSPAKTNKRKGGIKNIGRENRYVSRQGHRLNRLRVPVAQWVNREG